MDLNIKGNESEYSQSDKKDFESSTKLKNTGWKNSLEILDAGGKRSSVNKGNDRVHIFSPQGIEEELKEEQDIFQIKDDEYKILKDQSNDNE